MLFVFWMGIQAALGNCLREELAGFSIERLGTASISIEFKLNEFTLAVRGSNEHVPASLFLPKMNFSTSGAHSLRILTQDIVGSDASLVAAQYQATDFLLYTEIFVIDRTSNRVTFQREIKTSYSSPPEVIAGIESFFVITRDRVPKILNFSLGRRISSQDVAPLFFHDIPGSWAKTFRLGDTTAIFVIRNRMPSLRFEYTVLFYDFASNQGAILIEHIESDALGQIEYMGIDKNEFIIKVSDGLIIYDVMIQPQSIRKFTFATTPKILQASEALNRFAIFPVFRATGDKLQYLNNGRISKVFNFPAWYTQPHGTPAEAFSDTGNFFAFALGSRLGIFDFVKERVSIFDFPKEHGRITNLEITEGNVIITLFSGPKQVLRVKDIQNFQWKPAEMSAD